MRQQIPMVKDDIMPEPSEPNPEPVKDEDRKPIDTQALDSLLIPKPPKSIADEALSEAIEKLEETEAELGLEYVGQEKGTNRAQRRASVRTIKRVTRRPVAVTSLRHPLLGTLTPAGARRLKKRRARNRVARASRKRNRG